MQTTASKIKSERGILTAVKLISKTDSLPSFASACLARSYYFAHVWALSVLATLAIVPMVQAEKRGDVLLEAEGFSEPGGWVVDQQSMDVMGSAFLLAHGMGEPVSDATTTLAFPQPGKYRLWVRTRD